MVLKFDVSKYSMRGYYMYVAVNELTMDFAKIKVLV